MPRGAVNTRWVKGRRAVRLDSIDDLSAEVDRVVAAAAAGGVHPLGNWSPAQVLQHIGRLIEMSFDGFPFRYDRGISLVTRLLRRLGYRLLLYLAFRPGFKNPPQAHALEPDALVTLDTAAAYLRGQIDRIRRGEQMTQEAAVEGPYTHDQWLLAHLRHAALHLSFLELSE